MATYTWEGNPANLSCEVEAHPGASVVWFRDGIQLPSPNTTNLKIYSTPTVNYLEVMNQPSLSSSALRDKGIKHKGAVKVWEKHMGIIKILKLCETEE